MAKSDALAVVTTPLIREADTGSDTIKRGDLDEVRIVPRIEGSICPASGWRVRCERGACQARMEAVTCAACAGVREADNCIGGIEGGHGDELRVTCPTTISHRGSYVEVAGSKSARYLDVDAVAARYTHSGNGPVADDAIGGVEGCNIDNSSGQPLKQLHRCRCHEHEAKAYLEALSLSRRRLVADDGVGGAKGSNGDEVYGSILEHQHRIGCDCGA